MYLYFIFLLVLYLLIYFLLYIFLNFNLAQFYISYFLQTWDLWTLPMEEWRYRKALRMKAYSKSLVQTNNRNETFEDSKITDLIIFTMNISWIQLHDNNVAILQALWLYFSLFNFEELKITIKINVNMNGCKREKSWINQMQFQTSLGENETQKIKVFQTNFILNSVK